jgi:hypothetical protein
VIQTPVQEQRLIWSLWLAAAIVFVGGLTPLFFGGTSSRVATVIVPFSVGAVGLAVCALLHNQSRTTVAIVYFLAGLAIVYGLLSIFSLPVRLAALGACPIAPDPCASGLPRALSDGENTGLGSAAAFGIVGLMVGFLGLATLYRRPVLPPFVPPLRTIPPIPQASPAGVSSPAADSPVPPAAEASNSAVSADHREEEPELPAPEELPELPAHESSTSNS